MCWTSADLVERETAEAKPVESGIERFDLVVEDVDDLAVVHEGEAAQMHCFEAGAEAGLECVEVVACLRARWHVCGSAVLAPGGGTPESSDRRSRQHDAEAGIQAVAYGRGVGRT